MNGQRDRGQGSGEDLPRGCGRSTGSSFDVAAGSVFGLLGPNGAGKSTTVKILTTLSRPDAGEADVAGIDVLQPARPGAPRDRLRGAEVGRRRARHGAREPAAPGPPVRHERPRARAARRHDCSSASAWPTRRAASTRTYSGGMQRKLDVAMGLVHRPQVLFLDEPTTGLDPEARADMWPEIERLAGEEGLTILLTTHYLEEADRLARRLAIVDQGRIVAEGTPDELKSELRGDAVHVELERAPRPTGASPRRWRRPARRARRRRRARPPAARARRQRRPRRAGRCCRPSRRDGVTVASVTVARPSLDDVYLTLHRPRASSEADTATEVTR